MISDSLSVKDNPALPLSKREGDTQLTTLPDPRIETE